MVHRLLCRGAEVLMTRYATILCFALIACSLEEPVVESNFAQEATVLPGTTYRFEATGGTHEAMSDDGAWTSEIECYAKLVDAMAKGLPSTHYCVESQPADADCSKAWWDGMGYAMFLGMFVRDYTEAWTCTCSIEYICFPLPAPTTPTTTTTTTTTTRPER